MKLLMLEETRKPTAKRPYEWRVWRLHGRGWEQVTSCKSEELRRNWYSNICQQGALKMGCDSAGGFYRTYFLVREPWPEQVIEELVAKVEDLESQVRGLLAREDG
jgi:hypothetical protein